MPITRMVHGNRSCSLGAGDTSIFQVDMTAEAEYFPKNQYLKEFHCVLSRISGYTYYSRDNMILLSINLERQRQVNHCRQGPFPYLI